MQWLKQFILHIRKIHKRSSPNVFFGSSMAAHIPITSADSVAKAVDYLNSGCVVAVPTDTVYGLACDATNLSAIKELYAVKCRNENKPLAICLGAVNDVKVWAKVEHLPESLLNTLLPGPVTLILQCANKLDKSLSCNGKVGVRIPDYLFIKTLARVFKKPIALTSANLSNAPSSVSVNEFVSLWDKIAGVFDGGYLGLNRNASTVVDLSEVGTYHIIREGIAHVNTTKVLKEFGLISKY